MRYTEKVDKKQAPNSTNDYIIVGAFTDMSKYCKAVDKFGQLEDIEEELGISLETVGKILLNGIYVKTYLENGAVNIIFNSGKFNQIDKDERCLLSFVSPHPIHLHFGDYGITWALTKEELL